MKGVIYVMTTAVSGLIKIGQSGTTNFNERMRHLEANGYYNVAGLKRFFALDQELIYQLLLSFKGTIIYPENIDQEKEFDEVSQVRTRSQLFSFYRKGIKTGQIISFRPDESIVARVAGEREVEYNGEVLKLAPLTRKLYEQRGEGTKSGAYAGADHFLYKGVKLRDLPDLV